KINEIDKTTDEINDGQKLMMPVKVVAALAGFKEPGRIAGSIEVILEMLY
ncbi:hypothetical protein Tco_0008382, partial [Tanacetum coccineum]